MAGLGIWACGLAGASERAGGPWPDLPWGKEVPEDSRTMPACAKRLTNFGVRGIVVDRLAGFAWARGVRVSAPIKTQRSWRGFDLKAVCYLHREDERAGDAGDTTGGSRMIGVVGEIASPTKALDTFRELWGEPVVTRSGIPAEAAGRIVERRWTLPDGEALILRTFEKQEFSRRGDEYFWEWTDLLLLAPRVLAIDRTES